MSRLVESLNRLASGSGQRIGFAAQEPAKSKPMLLLVFVEQPSAEACRSALEQGADALVLDEVGMGHGAKVLAESRAVLAGALWGLALSAKEEGVALAKEMGADFVLWRSTTTAAASSLGSKEVGRLVEVDATAEAALLRALGSLPVDAVVVPLEGLDPSLADLMALRRVAELVRKPLVVAVPGPLSSAALEALALAGCQGVLLRGASAAAIASFRAAIDAARPENWSHRLPPLLPLVQR